MRNASTLGGVARSRGFARWAGRLLHMLRRNSRRGARRNIVFHYDLGNDFYALWLDKSMSYSSALRSEEHTSELQSLMRISYAVFCLKKKNAQQISSNIQHCSKN